MLETEGAQEDGVAERKLRDRYARMQQQSAMEEQKKAVLRNYLTPEAYERVMNVRIANSEVYDQLVSSIAYLVQSGRMQGAKITEEQIIKLLSKMTAKRETSIEFKHK